MVSAGEVSPVELDRARTERARAAADRYGNDAALLKGLKHFRFARHEVIVFHLFDPAELTFNFDQAAMFQDLESGSDRFIDPAAARPDYLRRLEALHADGWYRAITDHMFALS